MRTIRLKPTLLTDIRFISLWAVLQLTDIVEVKTEMKAGVQSSF